MKSVMSVSREQRRKYAGDDDRPLGSYLGTLSLYGLTLGILGAVARRTGRRPPSVGVWDVVLMAGATHRLSRLISKGTVTSPLRAPFTRFEGSSGPAELAERVRGSGARHAIGELVTCPFCVAQWVGTTYAAGLVFAPEATRLTGATLTAIAGSDWLQLGYSRLQRSASSGA
ncbi:DUF1360 domain-containing protein [Actinomadura sp. HBU206391]|uniref:DUF1360 domain-containing protein n=1 Tax=Actinomadura sp. HBU206391 TaxID=2731692 RepID=UPI00164FC63E|nr:DUF1360 domain-containing protein [Actinomadura sp. HBU206391]MBC6459880.1 DUF1360 domain-containing protein [Actinomadura sp. HBU206391]